FITKTRDTNVNLRMMVSPKGFTEPALVQAKDAGVGVFSLLPSDPNEAGFSVGLLWYARVYSWTPPRLEIHFHGKSPYPNSYVAEDILFRGRPVSSIVKKEISQKYSSDSDMRLIKISAQFDPYIRVHIMGTSFNISSLSSHSSRTFQKMCKFIQMTG